jgi:hypothetical protein
VNLAVGYGGRQEIADAVRSLLAEHAERGTTLDELVDALEVEHIAEHLYTAGSPIPTWSSAPAVSSACPGSCCGRRRTRSSTSPTSTGRLPPGRLPAGVARLLAGAGDRRCRRPATDTRRLRVRRLRDSAMPAGALDVPLEYVRLGLRFDRLESGFVDAYTGDPRLRAEVADEPAPTPQGLRDQARGLLRSSTAPVCPTIAPTTCAVS